MGIDWGNFLGKTTTGGNVYVSDSTSTASNTDLVYRPEIKYSPPEDIFYRGKRFKIDRIDTAGDSIHGDTEITIHAHRVTTLPVGQTGASFTFYADNAPYWSLTMPNNKYAIKKIVVNPKKNATTVIFKDGVVVVVKKASEDPEADIYSVVAYAVAKRVYGSNSALKREIRDCIIVNLEEK